MRVQIFKNNTEVEKEREKKQKKEKKKKKKKKKKEKEKKNMIEQITLLYNTSMGIIRLKGVLRRTVRSD